MLIKPTQVAGVILAAGLSTRLGRPKQLLVAHGRMLLAHVVQNVLDSGLHPVILVLGHLSEQILSALSSPVGLPAESLDRLIIVFNSEYACGQASSLQAGLRAVPSDVSAVMFIMGDQAGIRSEVLQKIMAAGNDRHHPVVVRPCYQGRPGGPMLWTSTLFPGLMSLSGDAGGRTLIEQLPYGTVIDLDLAADDEPWDVDTESDFQRWLKQEYPRAASEQQGCP